MEIKFRVGKYLIPVELKPAGDKIWVFFSYNKALVAEMGSFDGAKWWGRETPPIRAWSITNSPRNLFRLAYLQGQNPYVHYDKEIISNNYERPLYLHQKDMSDFILTRKQCIIAGEMGCVDGNAVVYCNRAGKGFKITISKLFEKWFMQEDHQGQLGQKTWDSSISTYIRSLCDDSFRLNELFDVLYKGNKSVVKLTLESGRKLLLTPDHEIATLNGFVPVEQLQAGQYVISGAKGGRVNYIPGYDKIIAITPAGTMDVYDLVMASPYHNFVANGIVVHNCGKTLSMQEAMERSGVPGPNWWYVAPKSALKAVQREFRIWQSKIWPKFMTYEALTKEMKNWVDGLKAPMGLVLDESARTKNPTAQRSQAALQLANGIRADWGEDGYVVLMSGAPAPKSPADWWMQCLDSATWILTANGPKQVKELIGQSTQIQVHGKTYSTNGFFNTGVRDIYKLETVDGYSLDATLDHRLKKSNGEWVELNQLQPGDSIQLANHSDFDWSGWGSFGDGYLLGLLFGDGNIRKKVYGRLQFFNEDYHLVEYVNSYIQGKFNITGIGPWRIQCKYINNLVREFDFDNKKSITPLFESSISSECLRGFLRGFFDADGHVEKSRLRISLGQTDKDRIYTVQRMLTYLGIQSKIQIRKNKFKSYIDSREIKSKLISYVLHITGIAAINFEKRIGFHHHKKQKELQKRIENKHNWAQKFITVKSITYLKRDKVFDIMVPEVHAFAANGLLAHNCEIACPGFLREGNIFKFKKRLAIIQNKNDMQGGVYPQLLGWKDDERKCDICGKLPEEHQDAIFDEGEDHTYKSSKNEVSYLYERLKGLVIVKRKKDCLDLPEKQYRTIQLEPTQKILNLARSIINTAPTTIQALTLIRELSDGFQYLKSSTEQIESPKEDAFIDILDELVDIGRIVVYAGFTASVDRCIEICRKCGWQTIRVDGRGWQLSEDLHGDPLDIFQDKLEKYPYVAFVGHPGAAGTGLTLTASPVILYYSNDFDADHRVQSEDRCHRPGMDYNRGCTIIDIVHLPTDQLILDNLKQKKQLQALTLGDIQRVLS